MEAISSVAEEIVSLSFRNYEETGIDPTLGYNPDYSEYLKYELTDNIRVITARYKGVLVGYAIYLIGPFKHNQDIMYADLDVIWISPVFRSGFLAMKMLKRGEQEVSGKAQFLMATSTNRKPISKLLERVGFEAVEVLYYKPLGVDHGKQESTSSPSESSVNGRLDGSVELSKHEHISSSGEHSSSAGV